ncbi:MAG: glycosyltransferase family 4 protein [Candidatus Aenigmatarchaeota archaeon]
MRLMFYCHVFYPENGGYAHAFLNLIKSILNYWDEVKITVCTPYPLGDHDELSIDRLEVIRLKPRLGLKKIRYFVNNYFYAMEVSKRFKEGRYDMLFIETFDHPFFIYLLDDEILNKTVIRVHSTSETEYTFFDKSIYYRLNKFILKNLALKKVKHIASTNKYHINFVKKYYLDENVIQIADKNFFIIPNTIDPDTVSWVLSSNNSSNISTTEHKIKALTLGRMNRLGFNQKGFLDLAHALNILKKDIVYKFDITIIGKGEESIKLKKLLHSFPNVRFVESLDHKSILKILIDNDVVVLPSRYEGMSMFALESLLTQNVVIYSKVGGLIELVDGNGFLFEPQNIEDLASCFIKLAELPIDRILEMKKRSLEIFKEKFSPEKVVEGFKVLCEIITQ